MDRPPNREAGGGAPPARQNEANGRRPDPSTASSSSPIASAAGEFCGRNNGLIDQVRRIIEATPEVRPEKVAPLLKALGAGTYEIDARELANILIAELLLKR